jgi:hypothetical protein
MKADSPRPLARLHIPSWVPRPVAHVARERAVDTDLAILIPLVSDPRMRAVWYELGRKKKDGITLLHPAHPEMEHPEEQQGVEMASLFDIIVHCAVNPGATSTWREVEVKESHYRDMARRLRSDAKSAKFQWSEHHNAGSPKPDEQRQRLMDAAETYRQLAEGLDRWPASLVVERDRGDPADRWLAIRLTQACQLIFKTPLYGSVATIMSVVLGRKIGARAVRQWSAPPCG